MNLVNFIGQDVSCANQMDIVILSYNKAWSQMEETNTKKEKKEICDTENYSQT